MREEGLWIRERLHPDFEHATRAIKKLYEKQSNYQLVEIYETEIFGKMLVLDGAVQTTEKDQHYYHEMIVDLPFLLKGDCKRALIIGGGDGGALHAMLSHNVEEAWLVELDEEVIEASKKYLPEISKDAFYDERSHIVVMDGFEFLKGKKNYFDIVVVDSPDPIGEAEKLYSDEFYLMLKDSLRNGGVVAGQAGSPWLQPSLGHRIYKGISKHFKYVNFYVGFVPSYPGTYWLYYIATDAFDPREVATETLAERIKNENNRYLFLNAEYIHACFSLPQWVKETIEKGEW
ncbi:MAG: polyamine aminopropyltransferase [Actinobacteria bacterium]|nr:polyamine aminopropyltransferase [Actinomycetota bacterium]